MSKSKKIGILTSGGDCSGLNAIIRGAILRCQALGYELFGIPYGLEGILAGKALIPLNELKNDPHLIRTSGSFIGMVNKGNPLTASNRDEQIQHIAKLIDQLALDDIIVIGGEGSLKLFHVIQQQCDIGFIAIPKTIDNDIYGTDTSIGFDTCISVVTNAIDQLQTTAASHDRLMILEVMGRDAGFIALHAGIAGGADFILTPERHYSLEGILNHMQHIKANGRDYAIMVLSEGVKTLDNQPLIDPNTQQYGGIGHYLSQLIEKNDGPETRVTSLGHIQRGGIPTHRDRIFGTSLGAKAIELISQGQQNRFVVIQNDQVTDIEFSSEAVKPHTVSNQDQLIALAQQIGIYIGK